MSSAVLVAGLKGALNVVLLGSDRVIAAHLSTCTQVAALNRGPWAQPACGCSGLTSILSLNREPGGGEAGPMPRGRMGQGQPTDSS